MPSRVEKNYNPRKTNKRTEKNQDLYKSSNEPEYRVISSRYLKNEEENFEEEQEIETSSVLQTEILSSFIVDEEKERDINKILREAKKTREKVDELERKRKLDKKEYNITKKINIDNEEEVNKFRNETRKVVEDEKELSDLIDTIYSKKDSDNLLDTLMPTSLEETIVSDETITEEVKKAKENKKIENSFFTNSMELSTDDLFDEEIEEDEEEEIFFEEKDRFVVLKVLLTVLSVAIFIGVIGFIIYNYCLKV